MGISSEIELEAVLGTPRPESAAALQRTTGDFLVLGAGGKMGPTLAMLLKRAVPDRRVYAVSRFSDTGARDRLKAAGVEIIEADLLDERAYPFLPKAENVYYLAGMKFGATGNEPMTWAMNVYVPALTARFFARSRIVALSTGNVYPFLPPASGGATEETPVEPVGEYAQSCLGRERIFQFFAQQNATPTVLIRLNYANEPRYGIIVDLARTILKGEPVGLATGYVNLIWQGDANDYIARSITLAASPAAVLNVTGPETVSVRDLAARIGAILGKQPVFTGEEAPTALLSNAGRCLQHFGSPRMGLDEMIATIVDWVASGKAVLGKPTKFEVRNGKF